MIDPNNISPETLKKIVEKYNEMQPELNRLKRDNTFLREQVKTYAEDIDTLRSHNHDLITLLKMADIEVMTEEKKVVRKKPSQASQA